MIFDISAEGGDPPPDRRFVDLIVQVKRLRDGCAAAPNPTYRMEGESSSQELFKFAYLDETPDGKIIGAYRSMGLSPNA